MKALLLFRPEDATDAITGAWLTSPGAERIPSLTTAPFHPILIYDHYPSTAYPMYEWCKASHGACEILIRVRRERLMPLPPWATP